MDQHQVNWAERERALASSAGQETQQLQPTTTTPPPLPTTNHSTMTSPQTARRMLPWLLILGGMLLFVGQLIPGAGGALDLEAGFFFSMISAGFLFFAFWKRIYPLLIPGCILAGVAVGATFANLFGGAPFLLGLAMGFLSIIPLGRAFMGYTGKDSNWPIFPAAGLTFVGVMALFDSMPALFSSFFFIIPAALILLGVILGQRGK